MLGLLAAGWFGWFEITCRMRARVRKQDKQTILQIQTITSPFVIKKNH